MPPKAMLEPELVDMIELAGNIEVWQDIDELVTEGMAHLALLPPTLCVCVTCHPHVHDKRWQA